MDGIGSLGAVDASALPNRFSELGSEEFVKIIFTELSHQDPLQPNDTAALLEQLSTLSDVGVERPTPDDPWIGGSEVLLDCAPLRDLARQELLRRRDEGARRTHRALPKIV